MSAKNIHRNDFCRLNFTPEIKKILSPPKRNFPLELSFIFLSPFFTSLLILRFSLMENLSHLRIKVVRCKEWKKIDEGGERNAKFARFLFGSWKKSFCYKYNNIAGCSWKFLDAFLIDKI